MTESKLFVLWGQGGSIALQTLFLNDLQGKEGLPREHFGDSWSRQWTRWPPKSSQGKEAEKCSICCSSQYQGLRWTLGRGILSSVHAQKKRTEGWKEAGRQQKPLWLLESLQGWECWQWPHGKGQHHPKGCGRNNCQEMEVPSVLGLYPGLAGK